MSKKEKIGGLCVNATIIVAFISVCFGLKYGVDYIRNNMNSAVSDIRNHVPDHTYMSSPVFNTPSITLHHFRDVSIVDFAYGPSLVEDIDSVQYTCWNNDTENRIEYDCSLLGSSHLFSFDSSKQSDKTLGYLTPNGYTNDLSLYMRKKVITEHNISYISKENVFLLPDNVSLVLLERK